MHAYMYIYDIFLIAHEFEIRVSGVCVEISSMSDQGISMTKTAPTAFVYMEKDVHTYKLEYKLYACALIFIIIVFICLLNCSCI